MIKNMVYFLLTHNDMRAKSKLEVYNRSELEFLANYVLINFILHMITAPFVIMQPRQIWHQSETCVLAAVNQNYDNYYYYWYDDWRQPKRMFQTGAKFVVAA